MIIPPTSKPQIFPPTQNAPSPQRCSKTGSLRSCKKRNVWHFLLVFIFFSFTFSAEIKQTTLLLYTKKLCAGKYAFLTELIRSCQVCTMGGSSTGEQRSWGWTGQRMVLIIQKNNTVTDSITISDPIDVLKSYYTLVFKYSQLRSRCANVSSII